MSLLRSLRTRLVALQWVLARSAPLTWLYVGGVSLLCRTIFGRRVTNHLEALVTGSGVIWPDVRFRARSSIVGDGTVIKLVPHLGEFDQAVLFNRRLGYEREVFCWLEREAPHRYDAVIEIGANVGVFSVFFDALIKANAGCRLKSVASFEPSLAPFWRLLGNLDANGVTAVTPFRAAVGQTAGFQTFFEPRGHLTNGSFDKGFAADFSSEVSETIVSVVGAADLEHFLSRATKVLLKVDAEGYEPHILAALQPLIVRYRPDLLVEVLPATSVAIDALAWRSTYTCYLVASGGLELREHVAADALFRDWLFLTGPTSPAGRASGDPSSLPYSTDSEVATNSIKTRADGGAPA